MIFFCIKENIYDAFKNSLPSEEEEEEEEDRCLFLRLYKVQSQPMETQKWNVVITFQAVQNINMFERIGNITLQSFTTEGRSYYLYP